MNMLKRIIKGALIWLLVMFAMCLIFSSLYPTGTKMPLIFSFFILLFPIFCAVHFSKTKPGGNNPIQKKESKGEEPKPIPIKTQAPSTTHLVEENDNPVLVDYEVVIFREKQLQSYSKVYQVFWDGNAVASLPSGGAVHFKTGPGHHKLAFKGYFKIESFFDVPIGGVGKTIRLYATISLKTGKIVVENASGTKYDSIFAKLTTCDASAYPRPDQGQKPSKKVGRHTISMAYIDRMEGYEFENFTADLLRKLGYENVEVTPSSGDQGVDVIAKKDGVRYAIQCKRYASKLGNTPVQEVFAGKTIYGCQVAIVLTNNYFTEGAKEAARATGVELWDRDKLKQMMVYAEHMAARAAP